MEVWKDIEGYEGLYQVSNLGRVKSLGNDRNRKEKILKSVKDKDGYLQVCLSKNGKFKTFKIHRLVARAFISNPNNLPDCNHRNEIKTDNRVENLEWCDHKYNNNYGSRTKRATEKRSKPVIQYDQDWNFMREWPSGCEIERSLGYFQSSISACCLGKLKTAYGFVWKYKEIA